MFYLTSLVNISKNAPFKTFLLMFISFIWLFIAANETLFNSKLLSLLPIDQNGDHFHALISSTKNISWVSRKMRILPGVKVVNELNQGELEEKVQGILGEANSSLNISIKDLGYTGIKIIFKESLGVRSQNLIRKYLVKLIGDKFITLGGIVSNQKIMRFEYRAIHFLRLQGHSIFIGSFLLLWILLFSIWKNDYQKEVYLLERFQRSSNLGLKSYTFALFLFIAFTSLIILYFTVYASWMKFLIPVIVMFSSSFLLLRRYQWDS